MKPVLYTSAWRFERRRDPLNAVLSFQVSRSDTTAGSVLTRYDERGWRATFYTTGMDPAAQPTKFELVVNIRVVRNSVGHRVHRQHTCELSDPRPETPFALSGL
jgi:hypothetical protein